jgi:hypothetical protein
MYCEIFSIRIPSAVSNAKDYRIITKIVAAEVIFVKPERCNTAIIRTSVVRLIGCDTGRSVGIEVNVQIIGLNCWFLSFNADFPYSI